MPIHHYRSHLPAFHRHGLPSARSSPGTPSTAGTHSWPCPEVNQGRGVEPSNMDRPFCIRNRGIGPVPRARPVPVSACVGVVCCTLRRLAFPVPAWRGRARDGLETGYVLLLRTVAGEHSWPQNSCYCATVYRLAIAALALAGCPNRWDAADGEIGCKAATRQGQKYQHGPGNLHRGGGGALQGGMCARLLVAASVVHGSRLHRHRHSLFTLATTSDQTSSSVLIRPGT